KTYREGREFALDELAGLGAKAKPAAATILIAMQDRDKGIRRRALKALAPVIDKVRAGAFRPLLEALADSDAEISKLALAALEKFGAPNSDQVAILRLNMTEKSEAVRRYILKTLLDLGSSAKVAAEDLATRVEKEPKADLRVLALQALDAVDQGGKTTRA